MAKAILPEEYRIVRHQQYEGLRGEYELQWLSNGDYQNVKFSHDQDELIRFSNV